MNLLSLLPKVLQTVARIAGIDVTPIVSAISGLPPEKKLELETAIMNHELEMQKLDVAALSQLVDEAKAATTSEDKFVRRARPMGLYVAYLITAIIAIGVLLNLVKQETWPLIAEIILPLYGNAAYYSHNRTKEKINEVN